jgi:hypothetical protein
MAVPWRSLSAIETREPKKRQIEYTQFFHQLGSMH